MASTSLDHDGTADVLLLVGTALVVPARAALLDRAASLATTLSDRQLVQLVGAQLAGEFDRVEVLAREYLLDHPNALLVAALADAARRHDPCDVDLHPTTSERTT